VVPEGIAPGAGSCAGGAYDLRQFAVTTSVLVPEEPEDGDGAGDVVVMVDGAEPLDAGRGVAS
jgi:hypothetical protein